MAIQSVNVNSVTAPKSEPLAGANGQIRPDASSAVADQPASREVASVSTSSSFHSGGAFTSIQAEKERVTTVIRQLQEKNQFFDTMQKSLDQMKKSLEKIVKNFPPFPPGSEDRLAQLRSYNSLRQQIDSLTIPPPPAEFGSAPPRTSPGQESLSLGSSAGIVTSLAFGIPALTDSSPEATDLQINEAISAVENAGAQFGRWRDSLPDTFARIWENLPRFGQANDDHKQIGPDVAYSMADTIGRELSLDQSTSISSGSKLYQLQNMFG